MASADLWSLDAVNEFGFHKKIFISTKSTVSNIINIIVENRFFNPLLLSAGIGAPLFTSTASRMKPDKEKL
jgi:hypothetical protein